MTDDTNPIDVFTSRMDKDKCRFDDVIDYIQTETFGFCGCGDPGRNLEYIMNGLAHLSEDRPQVTTYREFCDSGWFEKWVKRGREALGNEASIYFFFYWADKEGLSEHGGCIPGWLTEKGKELLAALQALKANGKLDD